MKPHLGDDARDFAAVAAKAFADAGGVGMAGEAEADPATRTQVIGPLLAQLGVHELDAATDAESAEIAAALCLEAGRAALPYPLVPTLLAGSGAPLALAATAEATARVDHADVHGTWRVAGLDGVARVASPVGDRLATKLGPFVGDLDLHDETTAASSSEVALHLVLTGFQLVGACSEAIALATAHVVDRVQFDQPLSKFQAVQFQLADAHVAVSGAEEAVQFGLWRAHAAPDDALADALAARLAAVDAARFVLRTTQQLHGASGLCDEYDVSVLVRHLQPALRLPLGAEATASALADEIARSGFVGLFPHGGTNNAQERP